MQKIREENSKVTTVSKGPANSPRPVKRNSNTIHGLKLEIAFLQKENDRLKLSDIRLKQSIFALIIIVFILSGMVGFEIWQTSKITQISTNKERLYQQIKRQLSESQENASEK